MAHNFLKKIIVKYWLTAAKQDKIEKIYAQQLNQTATFVIVSL